jgi:hypothetical protein
MLGGLIVGEVTDDLRNHCGGAVKALQVELLDATDDAVNRLRVFCSRVGLETSDEEWENAAAMLRTCDEVGQIKQFYLYLVAEEIVVNPDASGYALIGPILGTALLL